LEYNWFNKSLSTSEHDVYTLWNGKRLYEVPREAEKDTPPRVKAILHPGYINQAIAGNITFAFIIHATGRRSYDPQKDPWYQTEPTPQNTSAPQDNGPQYRITSGRPALECWQASTWEHNDKKSSSLALGTLGVKLDVLWRDTIIPTEFTLPRMVMLARRAGWSALASTAGFSDDEIIQAGSSRVYDDMKLLIRASWISSRNFFRDTTTTRFNKHNFSNAAEGPDGKVPKGVAQFVLQSPDVGTLSVRVLISVPSFLLFLLFLQAILSYYLSHSNFDGKHPLRNLASRATELQATQIYRSLDEKVHGEGRWRGKQEAIPYVDGSEAPVSGTVGETKRHVRPHGLASDMSENLS
jgi:hypothetical protein